MTNTLVGMYFISNDRDHESYRIGQVISQIGDHYLVRFSPHSEGPLPPSPLELVSTEVLTETCRKCGSAHWEFFTDVESRGRWITWLDTPDPTSPDRKSKVVHLKHR